MVSLLTGHWLVMLSHVGASWTCEPRNSTRYSFFFSTFSFHPAHIDVIPGLIIGSIFTWMSLMELGIFSYAVKTNNPSFASSYLGMSDS